MAQLQKGTTYITGDQVTAANLNALVDSGILTPGAVTDQTAKTVPLAADTILLHSAADTALRKTTMTQLFATPQPLGATTPSSVAATTGTFSSTLGVTGVATLGNGAILGTPASGNLSSCTGYVGTSALVTVGALNSGSITTGFGAIDVGADAISGGAISGTTGTFSSTLAVTGVATLASGVFGSADLSTTDTGAVALKVGKLAATPTNGINSYIAAQTTGGPGVTNGDLIYIPRSTSASNAAHRFFTESSGTPTLRVLIDSTGAAITGTLSATGNTITFGTDNLTLTDTYFGYVGNSYRVLRVGTVASQRSVALCVDPSAVTGGSFSGTGQILIGNNSMLAPNAAGTDWIGVLRATSGTVVIGPSLTSGELVGGVAGTATFSSTGLAVTGGITATANVIIGGGAGNAIILNASGSGNGLITNFAANEFALATVASGTTNSTGTPILSWAHGNGVKIGSPTDYKGVGTLNLAADVYKNGTAYTNPDYVIEKWATGSIVKYADKVGAKEYNGLEPLSAVEAYAKEKLHLPRFGQNAEHGIFSGSDALLASVEEAYLYLFQQDAELQSLRKRLAALESK